MGARPARKRSGVAIACAVVAIAVVCGVTAHTFHTESELHEATLDLLEPLRSGDVDAAYAALSTDRRAALSRDSFAALAEHPALRSTDGIALGRVRTQRDDAEACVRGSSSVDGEAWALELHLRKEVTGWRVHSLAVQPPASQHLAVLLEECGEVPAGPHTGPRPQRLTPRLD